MNRRRFTPQFAALALASSLWGSPVFGHGLKAHIDDSAPATVAPATSPPGSSSPDARPDAPTSARRDDPLPASLPFNFGGPFELIDQDGALRRDTDFRGSFMLVFFGYVQCQSICPIALRRAAAALNQLGAAADRIQPIAITIDPENDTPEALRQYVKTIHPRLIGLTGSTAQIKRAAAAYGVDSRLIGPSPSGAPVYAHGSFLFLMAPDGKFLTLLPPTLSEDAMAKTLTKYLRKYPQ